MFVHVHNLWERMKSLENPLHVITVVEILLPNSSVLDQQPCAPSLLAGSMMVYFPMVKAVTLTQIMVIHDPIPSI
jgi:hypothetical protein